MDDYDYEYYDYNLRVNSGGSGQKPKTCGERRNFNDLNSKTPGLASPNEFPWTCIIMEKEKFIGGCVIVPDKSDNDISKGSSKVITAATKFTWVNLNNEREILDYK